MTLRAFFSRPLRIIPVLLFLSILALFVYESQSSFSLSRFQVPYKPTSPPSNNTAESTPANSHSDGIDWSQYAYVQYVTNSVYLCNSLVLFTALARYGSKADRVLLYPGNMMAPDAKKGWGKDVKLLIKARDDLKVKLVATKVQHKATTDTTWGDSFTKLLAFNQTQYKRVLTIDSDSLVLNHMDELFLLPPSTVSMPLAYWLYPKQDVLSSQLMLVMPSTSEMEKVKNAIDEAANDQYDMEIVNMLYRDTAGSIPHRAYDMLSQEFGSKNHTVYLGSAEEVWDPVAAYNEAKMIHFSDWPMPKPWRQTPPEVQLEAQPHCPEEQGECLDRMMWEKVYHEFTSRRLEICGKSWF